MIYFQLKRNSHSGHIFKKHSQPCQFDRECKNTLTYWRHFWESTVSQSSWQEMPEHTHSLDTFLENTVSQSSLAGNARTHSHARHIFREQCQSVQQEMPEHTHSLDTFLESTVSQSSLGENAWTHSHTRHICREHCQPAQFGRKCLDTLTS